MSWTNTSNFPGLWLPTLSWASWFLRGALNLGFLCDDAIWLLNSQRNWFQVDQGLYQFLGFEYALVGIIYQGFQFNPLPYHTLSLGLVIGNAGLLCFLARSLGFEP